MNKANKSQWVSLKKRVYITIVIVLSEREKNWVERDTMRGKEVGGYRLS